MEKLQNFIGMRVYLIIRYLSILLWAHIEELGSSWDTNLCRLSSNSSTGPINGPPLHFLHHFLFNLPCHFLLHPRSSGPPSSRRLLFNLQIDVSCSICSASSFSTTSCLLRAISSLNVMSPPPSKRRSSLEIEEEEASTHYGFGGVRRNGRGKGQC